MSKKKGNGTPTETTVPAEAAVETTADLFPADEAPVVEAAADVAVTETATNTEAATDEAPAETEAAPEEAAAPAAPEAPKERPTFRKTKLKSRPLVPAPERKNGLQGVTYQKERKSLAKPNVDGISPNPTYLQFPTDTWGLTKDLKAALVAVASRVGAHPDKKALVDECLRIGVGHLEARHAEFQRIEAEKKAKALLLSNPHERKD